MIWVSRFSCSLVVSPKLPNYGAPHWIDVRRISFDRECAKTGDHLWAKDSCLAGRRDASGSRKIYHSRLFSVQLSVFYIHFTVSHFNIISSEFSIEMVQNV